MSGHNDYAEMETENETGERKQWTRESDTAALDAKYESGKYIEIDYVIERQRLRGRPSKETEIVLEIRVDSAC